MTDTGGSGVGEAAGNGRARSVLVTGGAGGIGRACARWFSDRGERVTLADLDGATAAEVADELGAEHAEIDVTDEAKVRACFAELRAAGRGLDVVVHTAGVVGGGALSEMSLADWQRVVDVSLTGAFLVAREAIPLLRSAASTPSKMVFLSSVNASTGGSALSGGAYAAAKAGIEGLTRHLARALAPVVEVNAVAPGPVRTPMLDRLSEQEIRTLVASIPAGRVATAEEVANAVGFLCAPGSTYITGTVLHQNGGQWM